MDNRIDVLPRLGPFSLGISYVLYFFLQYLFTPIAWWGAQHLGSLAWMNDLFILFDLQGLDPFTSRSIYYSLLGLAVFGVGYAVTSVRIPVIRVPIMERPWPSSRAEQVFWALLVAGFALKLFRVWMGADVSWVAPYTLFASHNLAFFLWLNWLHWAAAAVINIAYYEARGRDDAARHRLRVITCCTNAFVLGVSLTTASKMASAAPLAFLLIIRQFYVPLSLGTLFRRGVMLAVLAMLVLSLKAQLENHLQGDFSATDADTPVHYSLFYPLFHRVNMSWVLAEVIEEGLQAYPDGTLGQFFVDILPSGMQPPNVFDGNEFGRELALIQSADTVTGVAVTNIGDLYINGGLLGIAAGMLLCGISYRLILSLGQAAQPASVLVYSLMWPVCIHGTESPVSALCASGLKMFALCVTVHLAITAYGVEAPSLASPLDRNAGVA